MCLFVSYSLASLLSLSLQHYVSLFFCFFFSSRRRHTRFDCDWSSDVCSSDLILLQQNLCQINDGTSNSTILCIGYNTTTPIPSNLQCLDQTIEFYITLVFSMFIDRKSTRLNSSHSQISYAVFCLKKNTINSLRSTRATRAESFLLLGMAATVMSRDSSLTQVLRA